jgi:butyrate kinase
MYTILAINPGSTSTKVAIYRDLDKALELTLRHSNEEMARYPTIIDQFDFRKEIILKAIAEAGVRIDDLDAVIGRGGLIKPIKSGVYEVNDAMLDDIRYRPLGQHASNLGALLAHDIAYQAGTRAFIADPVVVDELQDVARITGLPEIERRSIFHALNQKAISRAYADSVGRSYEELNLVVAHLGGGISVGAHRRGEVIDVNNALDGEGPFSPERTGGLPALSLAEMCFSGKYSLKDMARIINSQAGLIAHFGTNSSLEVAQRMQAGDERAKLVLDAMCYNVAKYIGSMAVALEGDVDAIILTGGIANDKYVCAYIERMVKFIAPVAVFPGENELEALAGNALRVLKDEITPKVYA